MSKLQDSYLDFLKESVLLQESFKDKLKKFLQKLGYFILWMEDPDAKDWRTSNKYMYLFHGTRPQHVDSIKREGLRVDKFKKRAKEESDITLTMKPCIFMSSAIHRKRPQFGLGTVQYPVVYILCKVETKSLVWSIASYKYFKDIPTKNLIWENEKKFSRIKKKYIYLRERS